MKQINNLIVCEVPKGATDFTLEKRHGINILLYTECEARWISCRLPPGNYEIIGVYSEVVNDEDKRVEVLNYGHSSGLVYTMLLAAGINYQKIPDTTDFLFIKKIK